MYRFHCGIWDTRKDPIFIPSAVSLSILLRVELYNFLQVELQQRRRRRGGGGAVVGDQPEHVLEEDVVDVDKDGAFPPRPPPLQPVPRHHLHQHPQRFLLEDEAVDQEHPPLLPHHQLHRRLLPVRGVLQGERAVAETGKGGGASEKDAAADGGGVRLAIPRRIHHRTGDRRRYVLLAAGLDGLGVRVIYTLDAVLYSSSRRSGRRVPIN